MHHYSYLSIYDLTSINYCPLPHSFPSACISNSAARCLSSSPTATISYIPPAHPESLHHCSLWNSLLTATSTPNQNGMSPYYYLSAHYSKYPICTHSPVVHHSPAIYYNSTAPLVLLCMQLLQWPLHISLP